MTVVIDTSVFLAAAFWRGTAQKCWALCAARNYRIAVTVEILAEYRRKAEMLAREMPQINPDPFLRWIESECPVFASAPLGKRRSRDPTDDIFLAAAVASGATHLITRDKDLLALEKPFGISILADQEFLKLTKDS